jgi:hypothetical protein
VGDVTVVERDWNATSPKMSTEVSHACNYTAPAVVIPLPLLRFLLAILDRVVEPPVQKSWVVVERAVYSLNCAAESKMVWMQVWFPKRLLLAVWQPWTGVLDSSVTTKEAVEVAIVRTVAIDVGRDFPIRLFQKHRKALDQNMLDWYWRDEWLARVCDCYTHIHIRPWCCY